MEGKDPIQVLVVSCAGPPKASAESLQVSKYLKYLLKNGLSLSLVTEKLPPKGFGWHTVADQYAIVLQQLDQVITVPVYYHRLIFGLMKRLSPGTFQQPDNEALFIRSFPKIVKSLEKKPQVIYSRSTPFSSAVLALSLKKHFKVPWLMHLSDPWVESPHFKVSGRNRKYHEKMEQACFEKADLISFTSKETLQLYATKYPHCRDKLVIFPNVYDDDAVAPPERSGTEKIRFVHTGNFYGVGRRPAPILKALQQLENQHPDLHQRLEFLFTGFQDHQAQQDFQDYPCHTVRHLGSISMKRVIELQRSADLLLLIDWELPTEKAVFQLSKTLDYVAARRPILALTTKNSTVYKMVEGKLGTCLSHGDQAGLVKIFQEIITEGRSNWLLQSGGTLDDQYAASTNARKLAALLQQLAQGSPISMKV